MPRQNADLPRSDRRARTDLPVTLGLGAVVIFFVLSGIVSYWNIRVLNRDSLQVTRTHEVITSLDQLLSLVKDAETGQRGYLLTGSEPYLAPYLAATAVIDERMERIAALVGDSPTQLARFAPVRQHIAAKLAELQETIVLRRMQGFDAALAVVVTDRGKGEMDIVRSQVGAMQAEERETRNRRLVEMEDAYRTAILGGVLTGLLGVLLSTAVAYLVRRTNRLQRRQEWQQLGQVGLAAAMAGEQRAETLAGHILSFFAEYLGALAGAFYVRGDGGFRRLAAFGTPVDGTPERFDADERLLGQVAKQGRAIVVRDVPDGYLTVGSALGQGAPRHLVIAPASVEGAVNAVMELGFVQPIDERMAELLERVSEAIGVAVRSAEYRAHLHSLIEETQRQSEELQAQGEELRVNNEELSEQGRVLKESQTRLEQQQVELEQTNSQLEEQAQQLESQRDDLVQSQAAVETKARELEQASQYKSDFLANMSHELRTPLNSSLILAKLLADNAGGNLTAEQIRYAQTIQSSGNDLLMLINDILDLSKIEAGHMEIRPETTPIDRLLKDLTRIFEETAKQKGLRFETRIAEGIPPAIETDRMRLEQVLKNLLSNACKFTEKGGVTLSVHRSGDGIAFAVADTGIGISPEQQQAVFNAFQQADGTISRRYGGTGLGLSISRRLAQLLGGAITLESTAGSGSVFTLTLPEVYDADAAPPSAPASAPPSLPSPARPRAATSHVPRIEDDRETLTGDSRVILVVEDDASFARILYDLVREQNLECLIASTAEEALAVAAQYLPSAVILDVGLPDHSGLSVLDRLKRDTRTRHIPVHVVSAEDHSRTALSLGAVGYMLKPVKREALTETLKTLETRLSQRLRRVLIVEDDPVQLDSVRKLLGSQDVETVGARTAAECLERLKEATFDCMVLDLSLPDATGYSLLETLSREDAYSFPPVIVYTGRDLSADEEQQLRRYSKSIIIKGAKSPERLLDEVTLFLHQVVTDLPAEQQRMIERARNRDAMLEGRRILVVEDDVRNVYAVTSIFEPHGTIVQIARNGREALEALEAAKDGEAIDLVLMDVMMPEMDGLTATREIRKRREWKKLPVIMLTAKAMKDDQERCLEAGANDYMAKPIDVEKLLSLVRVWMPR